MQTESAIPPPSGPATAALVVRDVWKSFPGVQALQGVSLECRVGEIHGLVGANGAGKSTLMNVLVGALKPDRGQIWLHGQETRLSGTRDALERGIAIIRQEFDLVPYLSVAENIYLGREPLTGWGTIDSAKLHRQAAESLQLLGVSLDLDATVASLSVAQQQLVEIAKALSLQADLIIMDEPSSRLAERELARLFEIARALRDRGKTIIYISHRLEEVFALCDRVTVLRDGQWVDTVVAAEVTRPDLIRMMVGKSTQENRRARCDWAGAPVLLKVKGLSRARTLYDINLELHAGEVLGLSGLMGSGKTSLARALFAADPIDSGEFWLEGARLNLNGPESAIRAGLVLLPEDRREQGLVSKMSVRGNIALPQLDRLSHGGFVSRREEQDLAQQAVKDLNIRTPSTEQLVRYLSGGNQQKVVVAKWLTRGPRVIIMDEPTQGIDVGAKEEIYQLIQNLAAGGAGILLASSELPELLTLCDTIAVLFEGRVMGVLSRETATQEQIVSLSSGIPLPALQEEAA